MFKGFLLGKFFLIIKVDNFFKYFMKILCLDYFNLVYKFIKIYIKFVWNIFMKIYDILGYDNLYKVCLGMFVC